MRAAAGFAAARYEECKGAAMLDFAADGCSLPGAHAEIQKAFDVKAKCRLELELRLDRFNDALGVRGGRVLAVSRGREAGGGYFAAVRYSLPLPGQVAHAG